MQNWWLDAVCTEGWYPVVSRDEDGQIAALMIVHHWQKWGVKMVGEPPLTQFSGVWFRPFDGQWRHEKYHFVKKHLAQLIAQLPDAHWLKIRTHYALTDWQPFHEKGFKQTTVYTYVIPELTDLERVFAQFNTNTKRNIQKAAKRYALVEIDDLDAFLSVQNLPFERQNLANPTPLSIWRRLDAALRAQGKRKIFVARDANGTLDAAIYVVWDNNSAYYLAGGATESGRQNAAMALLMWRGIQFAATVAPVFDFEGSMIPNVERFFRGFGAEQKPYFRLTKARNRLWELLGLLTKKLG